MPASAFIRRDDQGRRALARCVPVVGLLLLTALTALAPAGCRSTPGEESGTVVGQPSPSTPPLGEITVLSDPPGASVKVDGQAVGSTPVRELSVSVGLHRVSVTAGDRTWERDLAPSPTRANVVYVATGESRAADFRRFEVDVEPAETVTYATGTLVGDGSFTLWVASNNYVSLIGRAPGRTPRSLGIAPGGDGGWTYLISLSRLNGDPAGPVETGPDFVVPPLKWAAADHALIELAPYDGTTALASAAGQVAIVVLRGDTETIVAYDLSEGGNSDSAPSTGRVLASWRTRHIAEDSCGSPIDQRLRLVGWHEGKLLFLAPGLNPDSRATRLFEVGLWVADGNGASSKRVAWLSAPGGIQRAWLTRDGRAAVVDVLTPDGTRFEVADIASGRVVSYVTRVPCHEPLGSISYRSPDGWLVAYGPSAWGPPGEVRILDLKSGSEQTVFKAEPDEYVDWLAWSPDGRYLSIACGGKGEPYWLGVGTDDTILFPSRFEVVDLRGDRVAQVSVDGKTLDPVFAWSPDSSQVAVQSVTLVPKERSAWEGDWMPRSGSVYAGRIGETLLQITGKGEDSPLVANFGFTESGALVLSGSANGKSWVSLRDLATGASHEVSGYVPALQNHYRSWGGAFITSESRVLLATGTRSDGYSLAFLNPDGSLSPLASAEGLDSRYVLTGNLLTWTGRTESGERFEVVILDKDP